MILKKLIYKAIRIPLIIIFIKTPLISLLKYNFKKHKSFNKNENFFRYYLNRFFVTEYYIKLININPEEARKIADTTLVGGEGRKWAQDYYDRHFQTLEELKRRKSGKMTLYKSFPIYQEIINYIKINKMDNDKNCYIIQLGSSSGRDLEFFYKLFPNINYISTDVSDEILNFQKEKYNYKNFYFFKCHAEEIDKCIEKYSLYDKKIIFFSAGSLQYVQPFYLEVFFKKLKLIKNLNLFICDALDIRFINDKSYRSKYRWNLNFSHNYKKYAKDFKIHNVKVIQPYDSHGIVSQFVGHYYLHLTNSN